MPFGRAEEYSFIFLICRISEYIAYWLFKFDGGFNDEIGRIPPSRSIYN
jgi:hypothetical protein